MKLTHLWEEIKRVEKKEDGTEKMVRVAVSCRLLLIGDDIISPKKVRREEIRRIEEKISRWQKKKRQEFIFSVLVNQAELIQTGFLTEVPRFSVFSPLPRQMRKVVRLSSHRNHNRVRMAA